MSRKSSSGGKVASGELKVVAGFPDFWQRAHDRFPLFFKAAGDLAPLQNEIFRKPVSEPLHKVLRHIAKIVSNSMGAVIVLVLNEYGNDAIKVARSMFSDGCGLLPRPGGDFARIVLARQSEPLTDRPLGEASGCAK